MCGINGIISSNPTLKRKIPALNNLLKHRGPDDEGFVLINSNSGRFMQCSGDDSIPGIKAKYAHIDNADIENYDVVLAQRRLAIIDLSECGHGPMGNADGKIWITYNGEIYNYIDLREELKSNGFIFNSASDTEVIINSYLNWGTDCLNRFNGMWAFALWDGYKNQLFIARDRFGVKPLYYTHNSDYFAFSSEMKPLISLLGNSPEIEKEKIPYFIIYGNRLNTCKTYIKNIHSLPASHYLLLKNSSPVIKRYYDINPDVNPDVNLPENEEELKNKIVDILSDSIKLRFRSDVPVGTCLSGGFDSSSIVSLSSRLNLNRLKTFSAVWDDKECDESKYIDIVNAEYKCIPHKVTPKAEDFEKTFNELNYFQEIPTEGPGLYPQWYVMTKAKGNVKVLLDGQGGDEVFGGYFLMGAYLRGIIKDGKMLSLFSEFNHFLRFLNKQGIHSFTHWLFPKQYGKIARTNLSEKFRIIKKSVLAEIDKESLNFDLDPPKKFKSYVNNLSYHFITNMTIPSLLHYEDRSSMAHSLESRVPFLDYRLVETGLNLKPRFLSNRNVSRPLFRKALQSYLPKEIANRKDKLGYPTPFEKWTKTGLKDFINDKLTGNPNSLIYEYIDKNQLEQNLLKHYKGTKNFSWEIWRLLSLENVLGLYKSFMIS
jgi:asparagine synthase (glutamine-hydrolysing)